MDKPTETPSAKKSPRQSALKDWVFCFSLANLLFFKAWVGMHHSFLISSYYKAQPNIPNFAILINVSALAVILWLLKRFIGRSENPVVLTAARVGILFLLLLPLEHIRILLNSKYLSLGALARNPFVWVLALAIGFAAVRWPSKFLRLPETVVMIFSPFVLVTFGQTLWTFDFKTDRSAAGKIPPENIRPGGSTIQPRIVWLLFDELDQRLAFGQRPATINLPELDRFRGQAFYAVNAYPPARSTLESIPSLLTGQVVAEADPAGRNELILALRDTTNRVTWSTQPNLFSRALAGGFTTAVVGWFHPYPRVLGGSLSQGVWEPIPYYDRCGRAGLLHAIVSQAKENLDRQQYTDWRLTQNSLEMHLRLMHAAKAFVADTNLNVVFCHLSIPHSPGIFDRKTGALTATGEDEAQAYLSNLVLTDRAFAELRQAMETTGLWENSTVILTSDHWWRYSEKFDGKTDQRVPLLIKFASQSKPMEYEQPFNTVLLNKLALAVLRGELTTPEQAAAWLDMHRSTVRVDSWRSATSAEQKNRANQKQ